MSFTSFGDTYIEPNYVGTGETVAAQPVMAQESNVNWVEDFKEVTEEEFKDILDKSESGISYASINASSGNVYIVMENEDEYKITDGSNTFISYLKLQGIEVRTLTFAEDVKDKNDKKSGSASVSTNWETTLSVFLCLLIVGVPLYCVLRSKQSVTVGNGAGKGALDKESIPTVKFSDVEGIEELKADIYRLVDCLKNPQKYEEIGARVPKGVILYGPPGTGKTLIAKAIAGEAGVPFFSAVGSDFVEMYVGVGASRVRDLYKKARKAAPCIVFIDEIDAVAGQRGRGDNTERDQTINALLAELDGFKGHESIITICATNRLDMLDSAFKRAGRFDLKLAVGLPDLTGRRNILNIHSRDKKLNPEVDLDVIAKKTVGFSGAELETLLNESALIAVGKEKETIDYSDIDDAYFKIVMQGNKKRRDKITEVNRIVAWHESGHTLATKLLTDDSVSSVTIVGSSSGAGGVTFRNPKDDNILHSKKYLEDSIKIMYAGRAAEEIYLNDKDSITTGASQDIKQATSILKEYLSIYGMGDIGMIDLSQFRQDYGDVVKEATEMSKKLYQDVLDLLRNNYDTLQRLSYKLLEKETLDEMEIDAIIRDETHS
jgi:cell division protease FtsH